MAKAGIVKRVLSSRDGSARRTFDLVFAELERLCFRDASDLERFKPFYWGRVKTMHNITHMDLDDCAMVVLGILSRGIENFYIAQRTELLKYTDPKPGDAPKVKARAKISTWLVGHMHKKYDSFMSGFFAPCRAFEAGRIRIDEEDPHARALAILAEQDQMQEEARELSEVDEVLPIRDQVDMIIGSRQSTALQTRDPKVKKPGTLTFRRFSVEGDDSPLSGVATDHYSHNPDLAAMFSDFTHNHGDVINIIIKGGEDVVEDEWVEDTAFRYGLTTRDFVHAVRRLFNDSPVSNAEPVAQ